jgi:hypothetical protein
MYCLGAQRLRLPPIIGHADKHAVRPTFTATDSGRPLTNRQTPRLGSTVRGRQQIGNTTAKDGHR